MRLATGRQHTTCTVHTSEGLFIFDIFRPFPPFFATFLPFFGLIMSKCHCSHKMNGLCSLCEVVFVQSETVQGVSSLCLSLRPESCFMAWPVHSIPDGAHRSVSVFGMANFVCFSKKQQTSWMSPTKHFEASQIITWLCFQGCTMLWCSHSKEGMARALVLRGAGRNV